MGAISGFASMLILEKLVANIWVLWGSALEI